MYDDLVKRLRMRARLFKQINQMENCIMDEAADAIEELSRENESLAKSANEASEILRKRWIPVSERLPEGGQNVIAANKRGKQWDIDKAWLSCLGSGFDRCGKRSLYHVTHWMPLPEPPKEG